MRLVPTEIAGVMVAETHRRHDHRGAFGRLFCMNELAPALGGKHVVQINQSLTITVGAVRGLHFQQPPYAEMKLVRCLKGRVWDVAVDLRAGSPTFLQWHAEELTPDNARMLIIPEGCAHGFQVLEAESELLYLHTAFYTLQAEGGVAYDDPRLAIAWPLPITDLSDRDRQHPFISPEFFGMTV